MARGPVRQLIEGRTAVFLLDRTGVIQSWPPNAAELVGRAPSDAVGQPLAGLLETSAERDVGEWVERAAERPTDPLPDLVVRPRGGGEGGSLRLTLAAASDTHVAAILRGFLHEPPGEAFTFMERSVASLAADRVGDGIVVTSARLEGRGPRILYANQAFARMFGLRVEDARGRVLVEILDPERSEALLERVRTTLSEGRGVVTDQAIVERGEAHPLLVEWELLPVQGSGGEVTNLVSVQRDMTEVVLRGSRFRAALDVDYLTGLPSREHFVSRLDRAVEWRSRGADYAFGVLLVEITELRSTQRRWGRIVANALVEAVAWRIRRCTRPVDLVARLGFDRIGVIVEMFGGDVNIALLVDEVRESLHDPYVIGERRLGVTVSGAALLVTRNRAPPGDAAMILEGLDERLIRAASTGQGGFVTIVPDAEGPAEPSDDPTRTRLQEALSSRQLRVFYQPVISLEGGEIVGLEALVRWEHPERGLLPSRAFIHDAEVSGLIVPLGRWTVEEVCRQIREWRRLVSERPIPPVHVNLSTTEFWDADLTSYLTRLVQEGVLQPGMLRLEVTEATLARDTDAAARVLRRLAAVGVDVWLEGFGGGGLPLTTVADLPLEHLKVDSALVWEARDGSRYAGPLLESLIHLAREMGREAVAGGVETTRERDLLRQASCRLGQGYFFSEALTPDAVVSLLQPPD